MITRGVAKEMHVIPFVGTSPSLGDLPHSELPSPTQPELSFLNSCAHGPSMGLAALAGLGQVQGGKAVTCADGGQEEFTQC